VKGKRIDKIRRLRQLLEAAEQENSRLRAEAAIGGRDGTSVLSASRQFVSPEGERRDRCEGNLGYSEDEDEGNRSNATQTGLATCIP